MRENGLRNPLVSVIVPNFNYVHYLPQRIGSILNQTYAHIELILLDDCSQDGSVEWLKGLQQREKRVTHLVVNEQNSGSPFLQWKKGIELAAGDYVWIAEADDYAADTFLEKTVSLLEKYPAASFVFSGSWLVDSAGKRLDMDMDHWTESQLHNPDGFKLFPGMTYVEHNLYWQNYVYNASGVLFRKSAYLKLADMQWTNMRYCGDWRFWTFMAQQGDVIELYEKLNYFRKHQVSVTVASKRSDQAFVACMKECMELTFRIENLIGLGRWKRWYAYGQYLRLFKKQQLAEKAHRQELVGMLRKRCPCVYWTKAVYRLIRVLSHSIPALNWFKHGRCQ